MKLNTKARYALRAMTEIAHTADSPGPVSLGQVAQQTGISLRYLEQLVRALREASLLGSVRGRKGGYRLARPAEHIRVGEIVQAVIGPVNIVDCLSRPDLCLIADICECRLVYRAINSRIVQALNEFSLADLANGLWLEKIGPGIEVPSGRGPTTSKGKSTGQVPTPCRSKSFRA